MGRLKKIWPILVIKRQTNAMAASDKDEYDLPVPFPSAGKKPKHPAYSTMVQNVIKSCKDKNGVSRPCIIKAICQQHDVTAWKCNRVVGRELKRLRKSGRAFMTVRGKFLLTPKGMQIRPKKQPGGKSSKNNCKRKKKKKKKPKKKGCGKKKRKVKKKSKCGKKKKPKRKKAKCGKKKKKKKPKKRGCGKKKKKPKKKKGCGKKKKPKRKKSKCGKKKKPK